MSDGEVDPGGSFGRASDAYGRGRPGWPEHALDGIPVPATACVLDLGAGTGKLTRVLAARYARVVAVEPVVSMRALIGREVPSAEVLDGHAEDIPLAALSVDAVFVAQAFHWFATDAAVAEIARVLRPGGVLALLWQQPRPDTPSPLPEAYRHRFLELRGEVDIPSVDWRATVARGPFDEVQSLVVGHEQVSDRAEVLDFAASQSWIACRAEPGRGIALAELASLLPHGVYRFEQRVEVHWARRG
jgi:SAM-dependent methyltransferase